MLCEKSARSFRHGESLADNSEVRTLKTQMKFLGVVLLIVLAAGPAYPAQNREILQLQKDMIDVQQLIRQLQSTVDKNNDVMKGLVEKMVDQVNAISGSIQKINQNVDTLGTKNEATARELRSSLTTLNGTIKELEDNLSSARAQINSMSKDLASAKNQPEPLAGPDDLIREAYVNYSAGLYDLAVSSLQEFISKYPDNPHAAEAHMRLGDALEAQKKYDASIAEYDFVLQKFPESDTSKAALLKKGLTQAVTNPQQANITLSEVVKKYPGTIEATTAQQKLKELQPASRPKTPAR
jgi:tol-pal system protein YbgF